MPNRIKSLLEASYQAVHISPVDSHPAGRDPAQQGDTHHCHDQFCAVHADLAANATQSQLVCLAAALMLC